MNLVAKEFVAAQDPDDPGVLILSQFAGAAERMKRALIVNPYSRDDISDRILEALTMDKAERIDRWSALFEGIGREDVHHWWRAYVERLETVGSRPVPLLRVDAE
jgi:trehalose 6-phosphate synthase